MCLIFIMPRGRWEENEGRGVIIDIIMAAKKKVRNHQAASKIVAVCFWSEEENKTTCKV